MQLYYKSIQKNHVPQNYIFEVFCASFPSRYYWFKVIYSAVLFVNFEHISHIVLLIPLFTLNMGYVCGYIRFIDELSWENKPQFVLFIYTFTKLYSLNFTLTDFVSQVLSTTKYL